MYKARNICLYLAEEEEDIFRKILGKGREEFRFGGWSHVTMIRFCGHHVIRENGWRVNEWWSRTCRITWRWSVYGGHVVGDGGGRCWLS